jgi:hypothetical protein
MHNRTLVVTLLVGMFTVLTAEVIPQRDVSSTWCSNESLLEGIDGDWWSQVQENIATSEYEIRWHSECSEYRSPNRAQNLRFSYYPDGFKVQPRVESDIWSAAFRLSEFGRCGSMVPYQGKDITVQGCNARVSGNGVDIEFWNSDKGMRENFLIQERINGKRELILEFSVLRQNLSMGVEKDEVHFVINESGGAEVLKYSDMKVTDRQGTVLNGYFKAIDESRFAIVVHDHDALYPISIDPLSSTPSWIAESDQADAWFGFSVSSVGDVNGDGYSDVIVGSPWYDNGQTDEGRAYVYHGSAAGLSLTPDWTAESDQAVAEFGVSVSTAGDVNGDGYSDVIVGACSYDNGQTNEGRAYVYHGSAAGLSATPDWIAESDQAGAVFGVWLSTAGDVNGDGYSDVIVGARDYDSGQTDEGRAYVYHGSETGLSVTPDWIAESDQAGAYFGNSVSSAGDVNGDGYSDVIVGACNYDNGQTNEGRAYVYHGSVAGLSTIPDWIAESDQAGAYFGNSVSTAGDVNGDGYSDVIVGAWQYDNGQTDEGRAYVYHGSATGLSTTPDWTVESDQAYAWFGVSVSTAGDVNSDGYSDVIVGACDYDNGQTDEGRAYVYHGSAAGLSLTPDWTAESDQVGAQFGCFVSTAGDVNGDGYSDVIVGARDYDSGQTDEGRAYVYHGSAAGLSLTPDWTAESDQAGAWFGWSVSSGDVNGDGYSDVVVGAPYYDNGQTDQGRVYVYHGSVTGLSLTPDWTAESDQEDPWFGWSVSATGDVNGDGYSDVVVGACHYDNGQTDEGRAYVYHGSATGLSLTPDWTAESDQAGAAFGNWLSAAGDVNGDGYSDVIVGAPYYDNGQIDEGRAYVYHGSETGLSLTPNWTAESDQSGAYFGTSVSAAGDVNGDGYSDVVVGALNYYNGQTNEGRAYVYHGSPMGLSANPDWTAESDQAYAYFGNSVSAAGDVNGDGYSDVIVGAYRYNNGQTDEGRAYVYHGSPMGLSANPDWTAESDQAGAVFGNSVSAAGDVNGDGYSDVIVGACRYDNGQIDEGCAYVYHGSVTGLSVTPDWAAESDQTFAEFGNYVSGAGDVNGDGYSDVIVGANYYDNGQTDEGGSFVYLGNEGVGVLVKPEQLRVDYSVPIVPALFTYSNTSFGVRFMGRSDYGRVLAKAQFEVKELGIPFSGSGFIETEWIDIDTAGVEISQVLEGFVLNTLHKWRARIKYHPKYGTPIHSRWYYIQANGLTECDLRIGGETGVNEYSSVISYPGLRLSVAYVSGGMKFVCNVPAGMGDGDFVVYNLIGAEVDWVDMSLREAGEYHLEWSGQDRNGNTLPSGVYFARVITGDKISNTVKFVFIR